MRIQVKCYATLAPKQPENHEEYEVPAGETIHALMDRLELPSDEVKIIFRNGRKAEGDEELAEGDRIGFFPPVGGG
jgi:molybdopterin converting factor small subunit